MRSLNLEIFV